MTTSLTDLIRQRLASLTSNNFEAHHTAGGASKCTAFDPADAWPGPDLALIDPEAIAQQITRSSAAPYSTAELAEQIDLRIQAAAEEQFMNWAADEPAAAREPNAAVDDVCIGFIDEPSWLESITSADHYRVHIYGGDDRLLNAANCKYATHGDAVCAFAAAKDRGRAAAAELEAWCDAGGDLIITLERWQAALAD